jgi:acetylornithine/succinyldiaminopimelate/putrescine aminotransferase
MTLDHPPENRHSLTRRRILRFFLSRGEGVFVWDTQGNRYLNCLSAYQPGPLRSSPLWWQASRLTLTSRAFHNDQLAAQVSYLE